MCVWLWPGDCLRVDEGKGRALTTPGLRDKRRSPHHRECTFSDAPLSSRAGRIDQRTLDSNEEEEWMRRAVLEREVEVRGYHNLQAAGVVVTTRLRGRYRQRRVKAWAQGQLG